MGKKKHQLEDVKILYPADEPVPETLRHKPVVVLPYKEFDGSYGREWSDAEYLSLGLSQWDTNDLAVKVLRFAYKDADRKKGEGKWSRQSEELPLHRPIDLVILTALTLFENEAAETIPIQPGTFLRQDKPCAIHRERRHPLELRSFARAWQDEPGDEDPANPQSLKGVLKNRLRTLHKLLDDLISSGKL